MISVGEAAAENRCQRMKEKQAVHQFKRRGCTTSLRVVIFCFTRVRKSERTEQYQVPMMFKDRKMFLSWIQSLEQKHDWRQPAEREDAFQGCAYIHWNYLGSCWDMCSPTHSLSWMSLPTTDPPFTHSGSAAWCIHSLLWLDHLHVFVSRRGWTKRKTGRAAADRKWRGKKRVNLGQ